MLTCNQTTKEGKCPEPAAYRFTWPGRAESVICEKCVGKLRGVANAIGLPLQLVPLPNSELNPEHPVTAGLRDSWHKLLAMLLHKYRRELPETIVITSQDIDDFAASWPEGSAVLAHDKRGGLYLRLVTDTEARRLADMEGAVEGA